MDGMYNEYNISVTFGAIFSNLDPRHYLSVISSVPFHDSKNAFKFALSVQNTQIRH
jgi:hypothetical protein